MRYVLPRAVVVDVLFCFIFVPFSSTVFIVQRAFGLFGRAALDVAILVIPEFGVNLLCFITVIIVANVLPRLPA